MKKFLGLVNEMLGELDARGELSKDTIHSMTASWGRLSDEERKKSLELLAEALEEDWRVYSYIMSTLLVELKDEDIIYYIERMLVSEKVPLWNRLSCMYQLRGTLFSECIVKDVWKDFHNQKVVYEELLKNIHLAIKADYTYLPWENREKKVVLVARQVRSSNHAPTAKLMSAYKYFKRLGYEVKLYICFHPGRTKNLFWYMPYQYYNCMDKTTPFVFDIGEGDKVSGYNLHLQREDYLQGIRKAMDLIYQERPEFVFELGERSILAGLCRSFTTVVTMGVTKMPPVTNAHVIARYFNYSKEDEEMYRRCIEDSQIVIDVKHREVVGLGVDAENEVFDISRQEFGIREDQFVIVIAGMRLDEEITEEFLQILWRVLEKSESFLIVFIGEVKKLPERIEGSPYARQMQFWGHRKDFTKAVAVGDVFLNPPRQGERQVHFLQGWLDGQSLHWIIVT